MSLTQPPALLNLDAPARVCKAPNLQGGVSGNDWSRYPPPYPFWPLGPPALPQFTAPSQQPLGASTSFPIDIPSSDSVTEDNQPIYPPISTWFEELDEGTGCGSTGYSSSGLVEGFDKVGIKFLQQVFNSHPFPNGLLRFTTK